MAKITTWLGLAIALAFAFGRLGFPGTSLAMGPGTSAATTAWPPVPDLAEPSIPAMPRELALVPPRPEGSASGRVFAESTVGVGGAERQRRAVRELLRGNLPDFERQLLPVEMRGVGIDGEELAAVLWVTPDYLAIGSQEDFLRVPLTLPSARTVAVRFGCSLPTTKIVDAVFEQATHRLAPRPLPPGPRMRSSGYYLRHRSLIEAQLGDQPLGELVAGHKKDVVLTGRLRRKPDRIAIYGWHRPSGDAIQPLSTVHGARYADYSHGIRLVSDQVLIEGNFRSIYDVLADPRWAPVLSDEGVIADARQLMGLTGASRVN